MVAPAAYTWDAIPASSISARAASLDDLGSAQLQDDTAEPPIPPEMPYADQLNQWAKQLAGINRVIQAAGIAIHWSAGVPAVAQFATMSAAVSIGDFTVTKNGTGDVTISWTGGTFPPSRLPPQATINSDVDGRIRAYMSGNSVHVKTVDSAGAAVNADFVVDIR